MTELKIFPSGVGLMQQFESTEGSQARSKEDPMQFSGRGAPTGDWKSPPRPGSSTATETLGPLGHTCFGYFQVLQNVLRSVTALSCSVLPIRRSDAICKGDAFFIIEIGVK